MRRRCGRRPPRPRSCPGTRRAPGRATTPLTSWCGGPVRRRRASTTRGQVGVALAAPADRRRRGATSAPSRPDERHGSRCAASRAPEVSTVWAKLRRGERHRRPGSGDGSPRRRASTIRSSRRPCPAMMSSVALGHIAAASPCRSPAGVSVGAGRRPSIASRPAWRACARETKRRQPRRASDTRHWRWARRRAVDHQRAVASQAVERPRAASRRGTARDGAAARIADQAAQVASSARPRRACRAAR